MALSRRPVALVLRALGVGDLLTGVPALRAVRRAVLDHKVVLAAPPGLEPLVRLTGAVDAICPARGVEPIRWAGPPPALAVNLHGRGPQSHRRLAALSPERIAAFRRPDLGVVGPAWRPDEHEVRRWCRLVTETLGVVADPYDLRLPSPEAPALVARAIVVHPGAAHPARRWPADRFAAVAQRLRRAGHDVVVTGGHDESRLTGVVRVGAGLPKSCDLAGRTTLEQLAALIASARLLVSGDTGVAHLAIAYGTPSVVLFGPTPPNLWGALDGPHLDLWRGQGVADPWADRPDPALLRITVDEVVAGALRQLEISR